MMRFQSIFNIRYLCSFKFSLSFICTSSCMVCEIYYA